jgi:capsular polysaccharide biosynthesis protein
LDDRIDDWQEGPGLVESVRRYRLLVASITLLIAAAALVWSSTQPVLYQGVVRLYLATSSDQADPGRMVRSQAEYLTSPEVLDRTLALDGNRMSRKELERRLTVEPARDADVITITVLDATRVQAGALAESVARAYRESVAAQSAEAARQEVAAIDQRQEQLAGEIDALDEQLNDDPENQVLLATRQAKQNQLAQLADRVESARDSAAGAALQAEPVRESATVPEDPAQPKPLRNAALGALVGLVVSAVLAWWLNGRRVQKLRLAESPPAAGRGERPEPTAEPEPTAAPEPAAALEPAAKGGLAHVGNFGRDRRQITENGSRAGDGSASGIIDFDQVATSVQQLFRSLDGPPWKLYETDLPQMVVEQIAQSFPVDLAVILLKTDDGVRTMGAVGLETLSDDALDHAAQKLIEEATARGPRLLHPDELQSLASIDLGADEDVSLALVPLTRDQAGFGVLLTGQRQNGEADASGLDDELVKQVAAATDDMVPYLWMWLLLRSLKLRLGQSQ